jgi:hypothetical protein
VSLPKGPTAYTVATGAKKPAQTANAPGGSLNGKRKPVIVHPVMNVEPVEIDGKHFVDWLTNGRDARRFGPYPTADIAKAKANKLIAHLQPNTPTLPAIKNDVVILGGREVALDSSEGHRLVVFCTRAAENLISDAEVRAHFEIFDDAEWKAISENPALIKAIRTERFQRINSGRAARESAAKIFAKAPEVLGQHLNDPANTNVRSKVDIHRELRATVHGDGDDADAARDTERFVIRIDLSSAPGSGDDVLEIVKDITPKPPQIEHNDSEIVAASEQNQ